RCIDDDIQRTEDLERAKEAAESASRAKSTFLFNMSHDIRTPLNAIMGFSAMAERYVNDKEKVMDCLKKINVSGEHLLKLINNVLDMARIESGRVELNPKPHRIRDSILNLSCIFQADARKKNLDLRFLVEVEDEIAVFDLLRTNQIILNLVGNAIKYTPEGGSIRVTFRQEGREGDRARYRFSVKDTGIGMSEAFQRNVFVAFERESRAATSGVEGTGLGLSITQRLVELMDGTISCTSEQGKGSEFVCRFRFPVAGPESLEEQGGAGDRELKAEGKRILLVEDNALNREISREILEADGFAVEDADDGDVAVEKIRWAEPGYYDLVLMDIQMPRMDGYEATRRIRALDNPELARIPIVAVTANAFEEDRTAALEAGMDGHVAKPIDVRILRQTIARFL
ncbi:MAG: response regulator, partial [Candidatus Faecousia sp.]|nr:response regulator [Candidatus Faecousia sp.]